MILIKAHEHLPDLTCPACGAHQIVYHLIEDTYTCQKCFKLIEPLWFANDGQLDPKHIH